MKIRHRRRGVLRHMLPLRKPVWHFTHWMWNKELGEVVCTSGPTVQHLGGGEATGWSFGSTGVARCDDAFDLRVFSCAN